MGDEDRWEKVRLIVREECERIEQRILLVLEKHGQRPKPKLVNGKWTGITEEQLEAWKAAYGAVDIEDELKKAAAWMVSNPSLAPRRDISRFLNTWFSRTQDRSAIRSIPTRNEMKAVPNLCAYCLSPARGSVGGYRHCGERVCFDRAMAGDAPGKMPGVLAKPVAGA